MSLPLSIPALSPTGGLTVLSVLHFLEATLGGELVVLLDDKLADLLE